MVVPSEAEYADYHQAMAQHAASLANSNQLHGIGQLGQIQMQQLMSSGLNLTVSPANMNLSSVHVRHFICHTIPLSTINSQQTRRPVQTPLPTLRLDKFQNKLNKTLIAFPLFLYIFIYTNFLCFNICKPFRTVFCSSFPRICI